MTETVRCGSPVTVVDGGADGTLVGAVKLREDSLSVEKVPTEAAAAGHAQKKHAAFGDAAQVAGGASAGAERDSTESSESDADHPRSRSPPVSPLADMVDGAPGMTPRLPTVEPTRTNKRKRATTPEREESTEPNQGAHRESSADADRGETADVAPVANPRDVTETDKDDGDAVTETDKADGDAVSETDKADGDTVTETDKADEDESAERHDDKRRSTNGLWDAVDYLGESLGPLHGETSQRARPSKLVGATERARMVVKADIPQMAPPVCGRTAAPVARRELSELLHLLEPVATRHAAGLMAKAERLQVETHGVYNDVSLFGRPLPFDFIAMQCATVQLQRRARLPWPRAPPRRPGGPTQGMGEMHAFEPNGGKHEADQPIRQQAQPNLVHGPWPKPKHKHRH